MPNLSTLSSITTTATGLSGLVLAVPNILGFGNQVQNTIGYQPQLAPGVGTELVLAPNNPALQLPPAFLFHYEGEQTVTLDSDITDHYVEDNTAIQDNVALRPEIISTHGFIGELNDIPPAGFKTLQSISNGLTTVGAYIPNISLTALIAYTEAFQLYQVAANAANAAVSAYSTFNPSGEAVVDGTDITNTASDSLVNKTTQSRQQIAFQQFYGYWRNRNLFTVQTPWAVFTNCAIKNIRAVQDADTNTLTTFEVTFKLIRTAQTVIITKEQRAATAGSALQQNGTVATTNSGSHLSAVEAQFGGKAP